MLIKYPNTWNSAYQPIPFELDTTIQNGLGGATLIANASGKLRLDADTSPYGTAFGSKFVIVKSGAYKGLHKIVSMSSTQILTDTDYVGGVGTNTSVTGAWPYKLRVHYGYPQQTSYFDLDVNYKMDGSAECDLSGAIRSAFDIKPPVLGIDPNMFTHFKVQVIPGVALNTYLTAESLSVNILFGYDWTINKWYAVNGCLPNNILAAKIANGENISEDKTVLFTCGLTHYSKIIGDVLINNVFGSGSLPPALGGIGYMQIENTFIVS